MNPLCMGFSYGQHLYAFHMYVISSEYHCLGNAIFLCLRRTSIQRVSYLNQNHMTESAVCGIGNLNFLCVMSIIPPDAGPDDLLH